MTQGTKRPSEILLSSSLSAAFEDSNRAQQIRFAFCKRDETLDAAGERFVDMVEIDGSPPPELITRTTFYESYTYTVYRKRPSGWQSWYTGGGGGC